MKIWIAIAATLIAGHAQAATIYLCKAYNGSMFWAQAHCNQHNAFIERMETVADGIPWDQQVRQAETGRSASTRQVQISTADSQRQIKCAQLVAERNKIESFKLPRWQFDPEIWSVIPLIAKSLGTTDGWQLLTFLESPSPALDGKAPRVALEQGVPVERVLALATASAH